MPPFLHRQSGIIGAALISPQIPYSLIVDGVHINAETVVLCWKCNPEGLILISDATEALGLPEGRYKLGTNAIEVKGDAIYLVGTTTIAGSNLRLDKGVRLLHALTRCSKEEALEAASLKPAKLLELYPKKGSLSPGADADFVVLTEDLEVDATYVGGTLAWQLHDSRR
jgi:N-acetylglucosamine-6-phosphate deacetylase